MGCTSSSLNRQHSSRSSRKRVFQHAPKQSISVVGILLHKGNSLDAGGSTAHNLSKSVSKKSTSLRHGESQLVEEEASGMPGIGYHSPSWAVNNTEDAVPPLLQSPPKLCIEQERRLRCANLEVPATGMAELTSDEDDDEGDGFEFAKVEGNLASFNPEQGAVWTSITSFNSEQGAKKVPLLGALLESQGSGTLPRADLLSESWEQLKDSSVSGPKLQILILSDHMDPPMSDSETHLLPTSPLSVNSSQLSPSSPMLENFLSNSVDRFSSMSEESLFFPGFITHVEFQNGSVSPSSLSFSESVTDGSPANDAFRGSSSLSCNGFLPWVCHSPSSAPSQLLEDCHQSGCVHASEVKRWSYPSPSWDQPSPAKSLHLHADEYHVGALIPGLPNDLAQLCLMRVPFIKYNHSFRMVSRQWRAVLSSEEFFKTRSALGIHEAHISFVVHGNRVQLFSLQAYQWFCLPPLPRGGDGNISLAWRNSPDWDRTPDSGWSSPGIGRSASDLGIDPYDWWQIDTVAGSEGTLFVIGGDQAEIHSVMCPSKATNTVHKYDHCRNCWAQVSPMQVTRSHAAAVCLDKLLYVAGGNEDVEGGASAEVYDVKQNTWTMIASMKTSMRTCVGMGHEGCIYVKGENIGPGCHVEGEIFNPLEGRWDRMSPGLRKGVERGPITSCKSGLFVADWKDSLLKVYDAKTDSWLVVRKLPAKISRLIGHSVQLYALTGKIKVDPYNHHVISDAPAEVWRLDLPMVMENSGVVEASRKGMGREGMNERLQVGDLTGEGLYEKFFTPRVADCDWECLWRDPKQMVKTGGLAWVPCIAHCTLFED